MMTFQILIFCSKLSKHVYCKERLVLIIFALKFKDDGFFIKPKIKV